MLNKKIYLNPKAKINYKKFPDYVIKEIDETWNLKGLDGNSNNLIDNLFHKKSVQTSNMLLKMRKTNHDVSEISNQIFEIFNNGKRLKVKQVILLDKNDNIILYYKR